MKPRYIVLFIWCCIAALAGLCVAFPSEGLQIGSLSLRWTTFAHVLDLPEPEPEIVEDEPVDELAAISSETESHSASVDTIVLPAAAIPADRPLQPFFDALQTTSSHSVRVVHYGDSQIEEDRITMILRDHLQSLYGGGGVGMIPLHQTIPMLTIRQQLSMGGRIQTIQQGPKRHLVYGPKAWRLPADNRYGMMGQVAFMNDSLARGSEHIFLHLDRKDEGRRQRPFSRVRLFADPSVGISYVGDSTLHRELHFGDTTSCAVELQGKGRVYGISLETPAGVIVDNIPMRGCLGTIFRDISESQLSTFFHETNTALIILQFGGNAIPYNKEQSTIRGIVTMLRRQVQYVRQCAPSASILFIGPSDMLQNDEGELKTHPLVPYMDRLLQKMAADEGIAYWSLYEAMGGYGSMLRWQERGLAGSDGVHFTRRGAEKTGEMLWQWILDEQERYAHPDVEEDVITDSIAAE